MPLHLDRLRWTARARRDAENALDARTRELQDAIVAAHEDGVPIAIIARETGLVRNTIYAYLRRGQNVVAHRCPRAALGPSCCPPCAH
jgi:hypothetical protein